MWTDTTRAQHARTGLALPSDLTDAEWAALKPFLPPPSVVGRPRKWPLRRILEAILYLLRGGLPWRMLPPCFPPVSTVRRWFYLWRDNGLWLTINHALLMIAREADGREASPNVAGVQRRRELGLDIDLEDILRHRLVDDPGRCQSVAAKTGNEGLAKGARPLSR